jgi:hypothetical protein
MPFDLQKAQENIERVWDLIEQWNAPNPLNPAGISDLSYLNVMEGLHDQTWFPFVPGDELV